jgi:3-oxoacyl-[acyl-carrier-protein] synthase-3
MGTRIEAAATATHRGRLFGRGALHLADAAARACLERAHHEPDDLDMLIHPGVYRDHNTAEPALASIIQEDVGANPVPRLGAHGTFSFDLLDGGCGFITAANVIDGFTRGGVARLSMIVAADADPSPRTSRGFPFAPAGGAVTLVPGRLGFERFVARTFDEDAGMFESQLHWAPEAGWHGRNIVEIVEAPAFGEHCVAHAVDVTRELIADAQLRPEQIELVIASQYPPTFGAEVARGVGIPLDRVPDVAHDLQRTHTAGPIAALEAAIRSGRFSRAHHVLFVTAGAGISIGVAWYRSWD